MSLALFFFGSAFGIIVSIIYVILTVNKGGSDAGKYALDLDNFDPFEPICNNKNSTNWEQIEVCPDCLNKVCYDEVISHICKSCGNAEMDFKYAARRKIVRDGKWVEQLRIGKKHYLDKKQINKSDFEVKKND